MIRLYLDGKDIRQLLDPNYDSVSDSRNENVIAKEEITTKDYDDGNDREETEYQIDSKTHKHKDSIEDDKTTIDGKKDTLADLETTDQKSDNESQLDIPQLSCHGASTEETNSSHDPAENQSNENTDEDTVSSEKKSETVVTEDIHARNLEKGIEKDTQHDLHTESETDESHLLDILAEESKSVSASGEIQIIESPPTKIESFPSNEKPEENKDLRREKTHTQDDLQTNQSQINDIQKPTSISNMESTEEISFVDTPVKIQITETTTKIDKVDANEVKPKDTSNTVQIPPAKLAESLETPFGHTNIPVVETSKKSSDSNEDTLKTNNEESPVLDIVSTKKNKVTTDIKTSECDTTVPPRQSSKSSPQGSRETSRPSSRRSSRRCSHDERILPGFLSRPESPLKDGLATKESADAEITTLLDKVIDTVNGKGEPDVSEEIRSRPHSRLSHDERIVPGVVSRPASPIEEDKI